MLITAGVIEAVGNVVGVFSATDVFVAWAGGIEEIVGTARSDEKEIHEEAKKEKKRIWNNNVFFI